MAGKVGYNAKLVNSVGINGGESLEIEFPTLYGCILFSMSYSDETSLFIVRAWNGIVDVTPLAKSLKSFELTNTSKVLIIKNKTSNRIGISYGWHNLTNI